MIQGSIPNSRHSRSFPMADSARKDVSACRVVMLLCVAVLTFASAGRAQMIFADGFESGTLCAWSSANPAAICDVQFPILVDPMAFFTGTSTDVRFQARVLPPGPPPERLEIFRLDDDENPIGGALCELLDNGDLGNGDDIGGDSVFSCFIGFQESGETRIALALVETKSGKTVVGPALFLDVVDQLTGEEQQTLLDRQGDADQIWQDNLAAFGDTLQARQETAAMLATLPGIAESGVSSDGFTVWIRYESGVRGGLMLSPPGTRGGGPVPLGVRQSARAPVSPDDARPPADFPPVSAALALGEDPILVGNTRVMIWDAYNSDFSPSDEGPDLKTLFEDAECPLYSVTYLIDGQATVDSVKAFSQYGTVILVTHGAVDDAGQVVFLTREEATLGKILVHAIDLVLGRVSIMGDVFAIRPGFISSLSGSFDNTIVYNGSCQSSANGTMSGAFMGKGAESYFGFTKVVNSPFAQSSANQLFDPLVEDLDNTGDAFAGVAPKVDPTAPNATFTHAGDDDVEYSGGFRDGSFEKGALGAWTGSGDARVISQLGEFSTTDGSFMGIISTGLGFTTSSGAISQDFCLPETATHLKFAWNFSSEEFIEWCGSAYPFDDPFEVELVTDSGSTMLFSRTIDTLCASVSPSGLAFDQSGAGCVPSTDVGWGTGGNDCTVWSTAWQAESLDISGIASANGGKGVTLIFRNYDAGDSIFDTAVTLDAIDIEVP